MTEEKVEDRPEHDLSNDAQGLDDLITIVLTADNHLGSTAFGPQPRKREERQQRLRHAFQQATDFAVGQGVDLFVQAGDLFDTINPGERDRSFVAARLAQLRQAGIRAFVLGGVHDTPAETHSLLAASPSGIPDTVKVHENISSSLKDESLEDAYTPAPQISYARLGALHYFPPNPIELEPVTIQIRNMRVAICGLGVLAGQEGNPLARSVGGQEETKHIHNDIERADISLLVLHAPIEGLAMGSSLLDTRAQVRRASIEDQSAFRYILAGYHHNFSQLHIGECEVIVAGATQHIDFSNPGEEPGFVFLGVGASGIRWCKHIAVDALLLQRLVIHTSELWSKGADSTLPLPAGAINLAPTDTILERLRPLCSEDSMVQLRLEGQLTRNQYHQLDLNRIRRYGEEQCFALAIDDSSLDILPIVSQDSSLRERDSQVTPSEGEGGPRSVERFSTREELVTLADEWIVATNDEQEKKALLTTKEELLAAMDEAVGSRFIGSGMYHNYSLVGRGQAVVPTMDEGDSSAEQSGDNGLSSPGSPLGEGNDLPC